MAIHNGFREAFPETYPTYDELDAVIAGFQNSLCWSVLRIPDNSIETPTNSIRVNPSFQSDWMQRSEIVERIADTSGLGDAMSDFALAMIETMVAEAMTKSEVVALEPVCILGRVEGGYDLQLKGPFMLQPYSGIAREEEPPAAAASATAF